MSRKPVKSNPEVLNYVQMRLPGSLKNEVIAHCEKLECSLNAWLVEMVKQKLREEKGLPEPPPSKAALGDASEGIRAWAEGRKLLMPCGKYGSCAAVEQELEGHDGMSFCSECGIRVI